MVLRFLYNYIDEQHTGVCNYEYMQLVKPGILTVWSLAVEVC